MKKFTSRMVAGSAAIALGLSGVGVTVASAVGSSTLKGPDISHHQGNFDFSKMKAKDYDFIFIRATRGKTQDTKFDRNWAQSAKGSYVRGTYHFGEPYKYSGAEEAKYYLANGGKWKADGRTLPGVLDLEESPSAGKKCQGKSPAELRKYVKDFSATYQKATGRKPMIYSNGPFLKDCVKPDAKFMKDTQLWFAHWNGGKTPTLPTGVKSWTFHQYSNSGGKLDLNRFNGSAAELKALAAGPKGKTPKPTAKPSKTATAKPSKTATAKPSKTATAKPSKTATAKPSKTATAKPSKTATSKPTVTAPVPTVTAPEPTAPVEPPVPDPTQPPAQPVQPAPVDPAPVDPAPVDPAPVQPVPEPDYPEPAYPEPDYPQVPVDEPVSDVPVEAPVEPVEAPADVPMEDVPMEDVPMDDVPVEDVPVEGPAPEGPADEAATEGGVPDLGPVDPVDQEPIVPEEGGLEPEGDGPEAADQLPTDEGASDPTASDPANGAPGDPIDGEQMEEVPVEPIEAEPAGEQIETSGEEPELSAGEDDGSDSAAKFVLPLVASLALLGGGVALIVSKMQKPKARRRL